MSVGATNLVSSTTERTIAGAGLIVVAIGCLFVALFNPSTTQILPPCPLLSITGFACPGCGLTRAFHSLFHGDIVTAMGFNALLPLYVFGFGYFVISLILVVLRGKSLPYKLLGTYGLGAYLVISITFGIIRNIPAYPFTVLFP